MRFAKTFFSALLTSLTVSTHASADIFISRRPPESDYLVQHCATTPQIKCWSNAHLSQAGLRKLRREVIRMRILQVSACASAMFLCDAAIFPAIIPLGQLDLDLRKLIRSPEGGVVQVADETPGSRMFAQSLDRLAAPAPTPKSSEPSGTIPAAGS